MLNFKFAKKSDVQSVFEIQRIYQKQINNKLVLRRTNIKIAIHGDIQIYWQ